MFRDALQALVADAVPVIARHTAVIVAHDGVNRDLIPRFTRDCFECVSAPVKIPAAFDAQLVEQLAAFMCERPIADIAASTHSTDR